MFIKDVFKSVAKAFSRWIRPSQSSSRPHLTLTPLKKRPVPPHLKRKLFSLFVRINAVGRELPSVLIPCRQRTETEGLRDICKANAVSREVKGAHSVYYPFYLALWDAPVYYQCHILVLPMQHRVSLRPLKTSIPCAISEVSFSEELNVLKSLHTTHSSYTSSDSEESAVLA